MMEKALCDLVGCFPHRLCSCMEHDGVFWESSTRQAIIFQFGVERRALGFLFLCHCGRFIQCRVAGLLLTKTLDALSLL